MMPALQPVVTATTGTGSAPPATSLSLSARQAVSTVSPAAALPFDDVLAAIVPKLRLALRLQPQTVGSASPGKPVSRHNPKTTPGSDSDDASTQPQKAADPPSIGVPFTLLSQAAASTGGTSPDSAERPVKAKPKGVAAATPASGLLAPSVEQASSSGAAAPGKFDTWAEGGSMAATAMAAASSDAPKRPAAVPLAPSAKPELTDTASPLPSAQVALQAPSAVAATSLAAAASANVARLDATSMALAPASTPLTSPATLKLPEAATAEEAGSALAGEPSPLQASMTSSSENSSRRLSARQENARPAATSINYGFAPDQGSSAAPRATDAQETMLDANGFSSQAAPDRLRQDNVSRSFRQSETVNEGPGFSIESRLLGPINAALTPADIIGSRLHVQFTVDRPATAALIASGLDQLDNMLSATGIKLGSLAVAFEAHAASGAPQPDPQRAMLVTKAELSSPLAPPSTESSGSLAMVSWSSQGSASGDAAPGAGARDFRREQQNTPSGETSPICSQAIAAPTRDRFA